MYGAVKKFDYINEDDSFFLYDIEFFIDNKYHETKKYNKEFTVKRNLELNMFYVFDYMIVNYKYNNIDYKFYSNNSFLTFPLYSSEEIKNYVYTNKVIDAILVINEDTKINILNLILPFLGPNYNFYEDIGSKLYLKHIINYITRIKEDDVNNISIELINKINYEDKNYSIKLYDTFNNEYEYNDYLLWVPILKII
jgi:hypothetical protein